VVVLECVEGSFCLNPKPREKVEEGNGWWVQSMHGDGEREC